MKDIFSAKKEYENIEIPAELDEKVNEAIKKSSPKKDRRGYKYAVSAAAALIAVFTIGLNTNSAFAVNMSDLPIIGAFAKVLTIRSYEEIKDNSTVTVNQPALEGNYDINADIESKVNAFLADSEARKEEYKQAFLETGGTEEEWAERDLGTFIDYDIKLNNENTASFVITAGETWNSSTALEFYYNINTKTGEDITLPELLGENYIEIANEQIIAQINERCTDEKITFWGYGGDTSEFKFTSISENPNFYINKNGNPVICFEKYSIAPGYMGIQEFEITK